LSVLDTIASFEEVTGISGNLQTQISTLNSQTGSYVLNAQTGNFYPTSNPSGFITGLNQVSFLTLLPTGIEETGIPFPYSFGMVPRVLADLQLVSETGYLVGVKNVTATGYIAMFSDIIEETGIRLHTFATNQ
jgi:hypothetical protein